MPKKVDHDERRAAIVAAAQRTIGAGGLDGATMRKIAEAASCTTGLLSHYFHSRDEILIAALQAAHRSAAERMVGAAVGADPADALHRVLLEALPLDDVRRNEWLVWIAFWSQAVLSEPMRDEHRARYREWRAHLAALLADARRSDGSSAADDVFALSALIDGLGLQLTLRPGPGDTRRAVRAVDRQLESLGVPVRGGRRPRS